MKRRVVLPVALYLMAAGMAAAQSPLPNPSLTPGAIDPNVTQANIDSTICVRGWTRTVRPPEEYTEELKRRQIREYGYTDHYLSDFEEDHLIPLEIGGSPDNPRNLWPEPHVAPGGWGSRRKGLSRKPAAPAGVRRARAARRGAAGDRTRLDCGLSPVSPTRWAAMTKQSELKHLKFDV